MGQYDQKIWSFLTSKIGNEYGVAGLMGNLFYEGAMRPNNLENHYEDKTDWTDESYTNAVNNGSYTKDQFSNDWYGYGLAQWTYPTRKKALYEMYKSDGYTSIADIDLQLNFLWYELQNDFPGVLSVLKTATTVKQASDKVLKDFENPRVQDETVKNQRANKGQEYYNTYAGTPQPDPEPDPEPTPHPNNKVIDDAVAWAVGIANDNSHGYDQTSRWGPNYDCSSLIIQAYENAGCKVKTAGATNSANIPTIFPRCGFSSLTYTAGMELYKGDVLRRSGHIAMYIGDGKIVSAHINELGQTTGGQSGDQTGHEIDVSAFASSGSWLIVLRLPSDYSGSNPPTPDPDPDPDPDPNPDPPTPPTPPTHKNTNLSKLLLYALASE